MDKNKNESNYTPNGSLKQNEIDKIIEYLRESGLSEEDIRKIGEHKDWFHVDKKEKQGKSKK